MVMSHATVSYLKTDIMHNFQIYESYVELITVAKVYGSEKSTDYLKIFVEILISMIFLQRESNPQALS